MNPENEQQNGRRADHPGRLLAMVLDERDPQQVLAPHELRSRLMAAMLEEPSPVSSSQQTTLRSVLLEGGTAVEDLETVKTFAKEHASGAGPAQRDVLFLLYLLAIASALVHKGKRITRHEPADLAAMLARHAELPWLDEEVRGLLAGAVECCPRQDAAPRKPGSKSHQRLSVRVTADRRQVALPTLASDRTTVVGSAAEADIRLEGEGIAPRHASVWYDRESGEWTFAAIGDAVFQLNGRASRGPIPFEGIPVELGQYRLEGMPEEPSQEDDEMAGQSVRLDDREDTDLLASRVEETVALDEEGVRKLNHFGQQIMGVATPEELYQAACRAIAEGEGNWSAIVRIRTDSPADLPEASLLITSDSSSRRPRRQRRLSRTVLSAVRREGRASIARSRPSGRDQLQLSMSDDSGPRVVACVPLEVNDGQTDALYLDCPEADQRQSLAESLDYLESVARLIRMARTNLVAARAQARWEARERELKLAQEIQKTLLPRDLGTQEGFEMALLYEPVAWVGGDYCDVWPLPDGRTGFAVADVAGKGVPASLVMAGLHAGLRAVTAVCDTPNVAAERINEYVCSHTPEGMLVTMVIAFCEPQTGKVDYVNAGHEPPVLLDAAGSARRVTGGSDLLMGLQAVRYTCRTLQLAPGDTLLLTTDGLTESGPNRQTMFGWQGVCEAAAGFDGPVMDLARNVVDTARQCSGSELFGDDATVFVLRRRS
ncbi:MAG: SpoIIE family protein phosphatase [Phycisphaerae bacterium]